MNTVFLFSGQGSQYPGMARELVEAYPALSEIYAAASDILGFDLWDKTLNASPEEMAKTEIAQPAILAASLVCFEAAVANGLGDHANAVAGHSLGEYAAMVASGMLSMENGFLVIKARAKAMQKAADANPGAMCAVMGKTPEEIEAVCLQAADSEENYVTPVNYNSPTQTVVAGTPSGVAKVMELFSMQGARTVKLGVCAAFHSKLMASAAEEFLSEIRNVPFLPPEDVTFYSNLLGGPLTDFSQMPEMLARHIVSPVRFTDELYALETNGFDTFIECGPGKVLTGLVKKTLKNVAAVSVEDMASLQKAAALAG